jgi:restriction system protein
MNTVPQYHTLMLPLLKVMGTGSEMNTNQIRDAVAEHLGLSTEALSERLPSGTQTAYDNRMGWARTYLFKAGLIERPRRATYVISQSGKQLLLNPPASIDADFLRSYEQFNDFAPNTISRKEKQSKSGHLEIYEICQPLITIKKCLSASSQQIISAQAIRYCRQIDSYWILLRQ